MIINVFQKLHRNPFQTNDFQWLFYELQIQGCSPEYFGITMVVSFLESDVLSWKSGNDDAIGFYLIRVENKLHFTCPLCFIFQHRQKCFCGFKLKIHQPKRVNKYAKEQRRVNDFIKEISVFCCSIDSYGL